MKSVRKMKVSSPRRKSPRRHMRRYDGDWKSNVKSVGSNVASKVKSIGSSVASSVKSAGSSVASSANKAMKKYNITLAENHLKKLKDDFEKAKDIKNIQNLDEKVKKDIQNLNEKLKKDIQNLDEKLKKDIQNLNEKLKKDIQNLNN